MKIYSFALLVFPSFGLILAEYDKWPSNRGSIKESLCARAAWLMGHPRNSVCSPIAALVPLGALAIGARGKEAFDEMMNAIGFWNEEGKKTWKAPMTCIQKPGPLARNLDVTNYTCHYFVLLVGTPFLELTRYLNDRLNDSLFFHSKIYLNEKIELDEQYKIDLNATFGNTLTEKMDFDSPRKASEVINSYVYDNTKGEIESVINETQIDRNATLIPVNALYFGVVWVTPFEKTTNENFYRYRRIYTPLHGEIITTETTRVKMMHSRFIYKYFYLPEHSLAFVEIPFKNNTAYFILCRPTGIYYKRHIENLYEDLNKGSQLQMIFKMLKNESVQLYLPRFRIETSLDLRELYQNLGIRRIFSRTNSGLNITKDKTVNAYVSGIAQKAVIDIDEDGQGPINNVTLAKAKASGSTEVNANEPFVFYVRVKQQIILSGIFNNEQPKWFEERNPNVFDPDSDPLY